MLCRIDLCEDESPTPGAWCSAYTQGWADLNILVKMLCRDGSVEMRSPWLAGSRPTVRVIARIYFQDGRALRHTMGAVQLCECRNAQALHFVQITHVNDAIIVCRLVRILFFSPFELDCSEIFWCKSACRFLNRSLLQEARTVQSRPHTGAQCSSGC